MSSCFNIFLEKFQKLQELWVNTTKTKDLLQKLTETRNSRPKSQGIKGRKALGAKHAMGNAQSPPSDPRYASASRFLSPSSHTRSNFSEEPFSYISLRKLLQSVYSKGTWRFKDFVQFFGCSIAEQWGIHFSLRLSGSVFSNTMKTYRDHQMLSSRPYKFRFSVTVIFWTSWSSWGENVWFGYSAARG